MIESTEPTIRSRELKIVYEIPVKRLISFLEGLKQGKLVTTKCKRCGTVHFPPVADCSNCLNSEMEWIELSNEATIETFTYVTTKPLTFQRDPPYIIAIGRLKEGIRILARLTGMRPEEVKIGMKAKLVIKMISDDRFTYELYPFKDTKDDHREGF
ncbi:MAG: Zn-ribbon domain-containing OB-fold protein [Nitrososphaerota archaeon]|nr:Zn-ribbon domain-containing OB-fold protein [Nitrososphaerales archaeon]MDW8045012.1 Zn-ribbon domain-containing OB-fold protein [Nitrososphaerota archaeon]